MAIFSTINTALRETQAIIITPNSELSAQVRSDASVAFFHFLRRVGTNFFVSSC